MGKSLHWLRPSAIDLIPQAWMDALPVGVYVCDQTGVIQGYNQRAVEIWGRTPVVDDTESLFGPGYNSCAAELGSRSHTTTPSSSIQVRAASQKQLQSIVDRPDGTRVAVLINVAPLRNDRGQVCGYVNCLHELPLGRDSKQVVAQSSSCAPAALEDSGLPSRQSTTDLKYRVRNSMVMVQAIVWQTLNAYSDRTQAVEVIAGRVKTLTDTFEFLNGGASLEALVTTAFEAQGVGDARFRVSGPTICIGAEVVTGIALALHEMTTNAMRYGALSNASGAVTVSWTLDDGRLDITWEEHHGPVVEAPKRRGYGSRLIESALANRGRTSRLEFPPEGVRWIFSIPVEQLDPTA